MEREEAANVSLERLVANATRLKFPTGVFGKTCMLLAVIGFACAAIAWTARTQTVAILALLVVATLSGGTLWRLFRFADKNPSAAILEGAEFIRHEEIRLAARKGQPKLPAQRLMLVEEPEALPLPSPESAALPDPTPDEKSIEGSSDVS